MISNVRSTMLGASPSDGSSNSNKLRPRHQRTADRQHLLLASRQRPGGLLPAFGEPRKLRRRCGSSPRRCRGGPSADSSPSRDSLARSFAERRDALPDNGRSRAPGFSRGSAPVMSCPSKMIVPAAGGSEAGDRLQHRGLAGAVGADQGNELPRSDGQRNALDRARLCRSGKRDCGSQARFALCPR